MIPFVINVRAWHRDEYEVCPRQCNADVALPRTFPLLLGLQEFVFS